MKFVLVVIDTLRADHLGCYGYSKNTSPSIDKLAKEGTLFLSDTASDVPTQPSFTAFMTGKRGIKTRVVSHSPQESVGDDVPLLQELLASKGYVTGAVSTLYIMKKYFSRGFHYYMNPVAGNPSRIQRVQAEEINAMALPWIEQHQKEDFFLFVHYWDPHTPYLPPEGYRNMFYDGVYNDPNNHSLDELKKTPLWYHHLTWLKEAGYEDVTDLNFVVSQYDGEIRHVDDAVGELVQKIDDLGMTDETAVFLTADHGESLGEHGFYFDHADVYETTVHVPLIARLPGTFPARRVEELVQGIDVTSTILRMAGLAPTDPEGLDLREVASGGKGRERVYTNQALWTAKRAMRDKRYKLILTYDKTYWETPRLELYDVKEDPQESKNLAEEKADIANEMELKLRRWEDEQLGPRVDPLKKITESGIPARVWVENVLKRYNVYDTYEKQRNAIDAPKRGRASAKSLERELKPTASSIIKLKVSMAYGEKGMQVDLPDDAYVVRARMPKGKTGDEAIQLIRESIRNPVGRSLNEAAAHAKKVSVLITDRTRATPNELVLRALIESLPKDRTHELTIVVANGLHKPGGEKELRKLVGDEIYESYRVIDHDSDDTKNLSYVGKTSRGTELYFNREVLSSDLIIGTGLIEPHFFAGYSGGRKLLLPGVAGTNTVYQNHDYEKIADPRADYGFLGGNPIHEDMVEATRMVSAFSFIVNVLLDEEKRVITTFSGDPYQAHEAGAKGYDSFGRVSVPFEADITVVTNGGHPLDLNLYQAVKGMTTAARITKKGGVIIALSRCEEGVGHESFRELAAFSKDPQKVLDHIREDEPIRDQWQVQKLEQVLLKNKVVVVSEGVKEEEIEELNMMPASTFDEAFEMAKRLTEGSKVVAIPEGPYVIPDLS
ncbi:nickel-dependent lactate racemase [Tardisphaera miroshnichenkoae]